MLNLLLPVPGGQPFQIRISMQNNAVVLFQLRMWVSLWQGTHVLLLAAAWLVWRKEFLVSFLVRGNSYQHDNYHNASQELDNFSFFPYMWQSSCHLCLLFEYWTLIISTSWGHLEEASPLSPDSTFYLVSFNSSWLIDCKNLLTSLTAFSLPECLFEKADLIMPFSSSKSLSPVACHGSPSYRTSPDLPSSLSLKAPGQITQSLTYTIPFSLLLEWRTYYTAV